MRDLNYFPLNVESNIYSMTILNLDDGPDKLLVATVDCKIYCVVYRNFKSVAREVEFTYIPNGAKIMAIGSLKRKRNDHVIGITHSLAPTKTSQSIPSRTEDISQFTTYYLNIYASGQNTGNFDLDHIAQGCQTLKLDYVPYHLYQTESISNGESELDYESKPIWLLSGGDKAIHVFCEDRPYQSFNEVPVEDFMPELSSINGIALWIDVVNIKYSSTNWERLVALGFEDGIVKLYQSALSRPNVNFKLVRECKFDRYVTISPCVKFFKIRSTYSNKVIANLSKQRSSDDKDNDELSKWNLLLVNSTNPSVIFSHVSLNGLSSYQELQDSQRVDCAVTAAIGDTNIDGYNELLIGTHGRELLTYSYNQQSMLYSQASVKELNQPVYSISLLNLTGDVAKEVALLLASGILVMQMDIDKVMTICKRRVDAILSTI